MILPNCEEAGAEHCAERCRFDIETEIGIDEMEKKVGADIDRVSVTSSFGVAESAHGELSPMVLMENADIALRQAKAKGRNRVVRFSTIDPELIGTLAVEANDEVTAATSFRR